MRYFLLVTLAVLTLTRPSFSEDRPVVIELFTSQGCSSCPPADALLHELAELDGVVALALHVDYWDYIGWKDSFASPAFSERQRAYARENGRRMIYTPQMVINGTDHVVGTRPKDVMDVIAAHKALPQRVSLQVSRDGAIVHVEAERLDDEIGSLTVQILRYSPENKVAIERGENAGRTLNYANVVRQFDTLAVWDNDEPLRMQAELEGDLPVVVLLQRASGSGEVEAAAMVK